MKTKKLLFAIFTCIVLTAALIMTVIFVNAVNTAKLTVNASNGAVEVYVDGKLKGEGSVPFLINVPIGATVDLVAKTDANEFLFWTDNVHNTVTPVSATESNKISFTMTAVATYTAHFAPASGSMVIYRNINDTQQVLALSAYSNASDFVEHLTEDARLYGYEFEGWSLDVEEIKAKIGTERVITVNPVYAANAKYSISVEGGTISSDGDKTVGEYSVGTAVTIAANAAPEGQYFIAWKDSDGNVISSSETLVINVFESQTYIAEFSTEKKTYEPYVKLALSSVTDGRIDSRMNFYTGENELVEYGLIYAKNINCSADELTLEKVDGSKIEKATFTKTGGVLVNYFDNAERVSAKGYLMYKDSNNEIKTIYSNVAWSDISEILDIKHELRVDENGDFKVVYFSDVQDKQNNGTGISEETLNNMKTVIDRENPDLILFVGDNHYGGQVTEEGLRTYISSMVGYIEEKQIPWAHVYGNHDDENSHGVASLVKETQQGIYEEFEYCLSKDPYEELHGVGNYAIPVLSHDGSKIEFVIYALDSGAYDSSTSDGRDYIHEDQIEWYEETSKLLKEYNGATVPAQMFFHYPIYEVTEAWNNRETLGLEYTGECNDSLTARPATNMGLFDKILELGDVQMITFAHLHKNDAMVKYKGVKLCFDGAIGTYAYYDENMLGGRVANYTGNADDAFETHMSYVYERPEDNKLVELKIDAENKTVTNAVVNGPAVSDYTTDTSSKSFSTDAKKAMDVVTFETNAAYNATTGAYTFPAKDLSDTLSDGFSFEVYFKLNDIDLIKNSSSYYSGIFDYLEAGGFALLVYKNADDATKADLCMSFNCYNGTARKSNIIKTAIDIGEWVHVVFSYNGTNTNTFDVYVDGSLWKTVNLTGGLYLPALGNEPYFAIGAQTKPSMTAQNGISGSIGICNLYGVPATANQAKEMYLKTVANDPIITLDIDAANQTVKNTAAGRPDVTLYQGENSSATITADSDIGMDVITFTPDSDSTAKTTAYTFDNADNFHIALKDGFSYEVYFKITDVPSWSSATYIVDYLESGGFGIYYTKVSDTTVNLKADLAVAEGTKRISKDVNVGEWIHCVFSYNGSDNMELYVNGTLVGQVALSGEMKCPTFTGDDAHIAIAACAGTGYKLYRGMNGSIAKFNLYAVSTTGEEAAALYADVTANN